MGNSKLGITAVCQIGILVHNIEEAGKKYAEFFGMEVPPIVTSGEPEVVKGKYLGEPSEAKCKLMFFDLDNMQIELIQPDELPSVWRDDLNQKGEGIHHVGFQVKHSKDLAKKLEEDGIQTRMVGEYGNGGGCYHYLDTFEDLKMTIELLESYT